MALKDLWQRIKPAGHYPIGDVIEEDDGPCHHVDRCELVLDLLEVRADHEGEEIVLVFYILVFREFWLEKIITVKVAKN